MAVPCALERAASAVRRTLRRARGGAVSVLLAAAAICGLPSAGRAETLEPEVAATQTIRAPLDHTVSLKASGGVGRVVVSQPETVKVGVAGDEQLYVIGRQAGSANLLVYDVDGNLTQNINVDVGADIPHLRDQLAAALPGEEIRVTELAQGVVLDGEVSSPAVAGLAVQLAERLAPDSVLSRLHVRQDQVQLEVRIIEVSSRGREIIDGAIRAADGHTDIRLGADGAPDPLSLGAGVLTTRGGAGQFDLDTRLRALESEGELRIMARPTLVTLSGEAAEFQAGGELPYPVPNDNGQAGVQFKPYGAIMKVRPLVQSNGYIRVDVSAELTDLDPTAGLRLSGAEVPAISTRRTETAADLRDGESLVLAGMYQDQEEEDASGPIWLRRIPIVGKLISRNAHKSERRELAIILTARRGAEATAAPPERLASAAPQALQVGEGPARPTGSFWRKLRSTVTPPLSWIARQGDALGERFLNATVRDWRAPPRLASARAD